MIDVVQVYRRILKAAEGNKGVRLTNDECRAFYADQAVQQAIDSADEYEAVEAQKEQG